jgi:hypothetical protein
MVLRKFVSAWSSEFKWIIAGKDEFHALCTTCNQQLNISARGKSNVTDHNDTKKHKDAAKTAVVNSSILDFAKTSKRISEEEKVSAAEGSWAYHIVKHGHSFLSADCVSSEKLFQVV